MSADNYYVVRKHPVEGFALLMGFASDEDYPTPTNTSPSYKSIEAAVIEGSRRMQREIVEYGLSVHPECYLPPSHKSSASDLVKRFEEASIPEMAAVVHDILADVVDSFALAGATPEQVATVQDYITNNYGDL